MEQNVVLDIDRASGDVVVNPDTLFVELGQERPTALGGKNWPAGTYDPSANVMYFPLQNTCMTVSPTTARPTLQQLYGVRTDDNGEKRRPR